MSSAIEKLRAIKGQIDNGLVAPRETVRSFLLWFGASRRGWRVCRLIRDELKNHGLKTLPDFEFTYIEGEVSFVKDEQIDGSATGSGIAVIDPTYRVGRLVAANKPPISVKPDATLAQAVTLMLTHDFSQLPVMTNEREVKGIIGWKTIGSRLVLGRKCTFVRECMEPAQVIEIEQSLFAAISAINANDYALVRALDKKITGIITASDFNVQFQQLAEPFLVVGEIENGVRHMLSGKFTEDDLNKVKVDADSERVIKRVSDLTFGEYIRLIESEENWKKLALAIDRAEFVKKLDRIREIRNDVMHFDPDGLDDDDLGALREFAQFLKRLREVLS